MDQLKTILAHVKTHRFWIISGLVFIGFMATWYLETSRLRKQTDDWKSQYDQDFSALSRIQTIPYHPNPVTHKGMDALHAQYYRDLETAWRAQYAVQESSLVWPDMGDDFVRVVERLKPIENKVKADFTELEEPLTSDQRNRYRFFIRDYLPRLADIVGAHWAPSGPMPEDAKVLVDWNAANQTSIQDTRFSWLNSTPTTLEVLYAQEDMWILTALLEVVSTVNGDIKGKYEAAIKEINFLEIGPDAIGLAGEVQDLESGARSSGGGMDGPAGMGMGMDMGMGASGADAGAGGSGAGGAGGTKVLDPAENRYVDKEFKPLSAERLRKAYDSEKPEDAIYAVAKRVPVRMRFVMDQRKISRLLATCSNYKMQIEIRQVRVNCPSGSTFSGRSGGGMGLGGGMEGGGMMGGGMMGGGMTGGGSGSDMEEGGGGGILGGGMMGGGMMGGGMMGGGMSGSGAGPSGQAALKLKDSSPWDVTVELYGIVMLYNPVEISKIESKLNLPEPPPEGQPIPTEAG